MRSQSSLRIIEGLCSFLSQSSLTSNYNFDINQRRYSAPLNFKESQNNPVIHYTRRQSWANFERTNKLKSSICQDESNSLNIITNKRLPSMLEPKVINTGKLILSPIQEMTHGDCPTVTIIP